MDECRWIRDGDGFVGWTSAERVALIRSAAIRMRTVTEQLLADTEPDVMTTNDDGVITDVVLERAHAQFDVPDDPEVLLTAAMTRLVLQTLSRDAQVAVTVASGWEDQLAIGPSIALRESFLWFLGDMWIAYDRYATRASPEHRDEHLATSVWFKTTGASLAELAASKST